MEALATPTEPASAPRRARGGWLPSALLAVLVAVLATALGLVVASHGQIAAAGAEALPDAATATAFTAQLDSSNALEPAFVVHRAGRLTVFVQVRNSGPLPLRLEAAQLLSPVGWIHQVGAAYGPIPLNSATVGAPLHAASVAAGQVDAVAVRVSVACPPHSAVPAGLATVDLARLVLRYGFGPLHLTRDLTTTGLVQLSFVSPSC
jgi:hypothetical protein